MWVDTYHALPVVRDADQVRERMAPFRRDFVATTQAFVAAMFADANSTLARDVISDMASAPRDVALGALESAWSYGTNVPGMLRDLDLPVAAINAADASADAESLRRHGVGVISMTGVGHFAMMEDPRRFNEQLIAAIIKALAERRDGQRR
ncbi:MAG TPA: hypothetical protein VNE58_01260 [Casimicrobiaceae bacterium]|nr:hypothetical protein [Casimicrobiaceae bacterium]